MSHASVKQPPSTAQPSLEDFVGFGVKLLLMSIDNFRTIIQQAPSFIPQLPDLTSLRPKDPCMIPETECPPRCVCEVTWEASPGETPSLTVRVTNSSKATRTFQLHATPFAGAGGSPGTMSLAPSSVTLQGGHAGTIKAALTVPNVPEGDYDAEITVHGAYEQCVRVKLRVRCKKTCGEEHCTCDVVQGDPPVRIRAHHWYHHFQCIEPCDDSGRQRPDHDH
jgi:hypothetical protein